MSLLIFGAAGRTGQELVKQALLQGYKVTAFVRNPAKLQVQHEDLSVIQGDVINAGLIQSALAGNDVVISTLGAASPFKLDQSVTTGITNIVKAMEGAGVKRLIYMSAINVKESRSSAGPLIRILAPVLLRTENAGHEAREQIIRQSKLDWTLVRAGGLTNGPHTAIYRSGENIRAKGIAASISRADIADYLLKQVTDTDYVRKAVNVMY